MKFCSFVPFSDKKVILFLDISFFCYRDVSLVILTCNNTIFNSIGIQIITAINI